MPRESLTWFSANWEKGHLKVKYQFDGKGLRLAFDVKYSKIGYNFAPSHFRVCRECQSFPSKWESIFTSFLVSVHKRNIPISRFGKGKRFFVLFMGWLVNVWNRWKVNCVSEQTYLSLLLSLTTRTEVVSEHWTSLPCISCYHVHCRFRT